MPLTFAHPAAILPFSRKSRYIHFSALALGSMAPDFEYFLTGRPMGEIGHTFWGFIWFNLPLVLLTYFIYRFFLHETLFNHLPNSLQDPDTKRIDSNGIVKIVVFCYSALLGMITHVVWDSFTHINGYMVLKFPDFFTYSTNIYGFSIPLYKFLQHGSTLFGLTIILIYLNVRASSQKSHNRIHVSPKRKLIYWSSTSLLAVVFVLLWYLMDYVSIMSYGIVVVRMIDSFLLSLLVNSLVIKFKLLTIFKRY
ncbi:DUF4184 family protein [Sporosarcina sp. YIM B06819]|uniref:DUF4184 family protein n=1 Tax=Sporosarcina sp. YIM B06819 TaxID=3081769 RepID=UPI00298C333F|nr:DUF4184 family protein [Sporosarcina sp. YIM B06819]